MSHSSAFQHQPLDRTKSSLRLLTIRSNRSPKGLIKCRMWHDDVETIYTCLSYVWGSGNERHEIEINGRTFLVRQNLWDFLDVARKKYGDDQQAFWIDALCIDQDSLSERNHQVAQMGLIYSKADDVIAWLGFSEGIGRAFAFCNELNALKPATRTEAHKLWGREWSQTLSSDWFEFQSHQYWTRAWITQEVLLARRLKILVNDSEFDPSQCSALRLLLPDINTDDVRYPSTVRGWSGSNAFNTYLQVACKKKIYEKKKLVDLFEELPRRQCQIPRDQIYSLLSLASDTTSISVDYGSSDEQFISHVLDTFEDSLCLCSWIQLADNLDYLALVQSEHNKGCEVPVFRLPLTKPSDPWVDALSDQIWTYLDASSELCSHCLEDIGPEQDGEQIMFCLKTLCDSIGNVHFRLTRDETGSEVSYSIGGLEVLEVRQVVQERNFELNGPDTFHVYLKAHVLTELLLRHTTRPHAKRRPQELCLNVAMGQGPIVVDRTAPCGEIISTSSKEIISTSSESNEFW